MITTRRWSLSLKKRCVRAFLKAESSGISVDGFGPATTRIITYRTPIPLILAVKPTLS
ncbi:hypothetical protein K443DRAFT_682871 [Laccaria amethystina LaAM-08-1]|uniref:Uncharacterized protein n=1 Tax=Laccaria amethystina LaAM-08-1 TaxID=1095629 RepID=A0A0C9XD47_9AGAR|nr:hypothetical protein K443DRAFT_682871 [Laccaria amethystina LaAM-08-1]